MDYETARMIDKDLNEDIGKGLAAARRSTGLTIQQVADGMGVGIGYVTNLERGEPGMHLTLEQLAEYSAALGYRLDVELRNVQNEELVACLPVVPLINTVDRVVVVPEEDGFIAFDEREPGISAFGVTRGEAVAELEEILAIIDDE